MSSMSIASYRSTRDAGSRRSALNAALALNLNNVSLPQAGD